MLSWKAARKMRRSELSILSKRRAADILPEHLRRRQALSTVSGSTKGKHSIQIRHHAFSHRDHIDLLVWLILRASAGATRNGRAFTWQARLFTKCILALSRRKAPGELRRRNWRNWPGSELPRSR